MLFTQGIFRLHSKKMCFHLNLFLLIDISTISSTAPVIPTSSESAGSADSAVESVMPEAVVQPTTMMDTPASVAPTKVVDATSSTTHGIPMTSTAPEEGRKSTKTSKPPV